MFGMYVYALLVGVALSANYVGFGSFELPQVPRGQSLSAVTGWTGQSFLLSNRYRTLGYGQYINLQGGAGLNG